MELGLNKLIICCDLRPDVPKLPKPWVETALLLVSKIAVQAMDDVVGDGGKER